MSRVSRYYCSAPLPSRDCLPLGAQLKCATMLKYNMFNGLQFIMCVCVSPEKYIYKGYYFKIKMYSDITHRTVSHDGHLIFPQLVAMMIELFVVDFRWTHFSKPFSLNVVSLTKESPLSRHPRHSEIYGSPPPLLRPKKNILESWG